MIKVPDNECHVLLSKKVDYESACKAVRVANNDLGGTLAMQDASSLVELKSNLKRDYLEYLSHVCKVILNAFPKGGLSSNILEFKDGWYGVLCTNPNNELGYDLKLEFLLEKDLSLLERDNSTGSLRHYSKSELDVTMPAYIDEEALIEYKELLKSKAECLLCEYIPNYYKGKTSSSNTIRPSKHAGIRWIQRVMNVFPISEAEDYCNQNYKEVNKSILDSFSKSTKLWEGLDGVSYWFDDNNLMYVLDKDNIIVTLYEEDFGFSKHINRSIVLMQIEEVKKAQKRLIEVEEKTEKTIGHLELDIERIDEEIKRLRSKIDFYESSKQTVLATKEKESKVLQMERDMFVKQTRILFKKREVWMGEHQ